MGYCNPGRHLGNGGQTQARLARASGQDDVPSGSLVGRVQSEVHCRNQLRLGDVLGCLWPTTKSCLGTRANLRGHRRERRRERSSNYDIVMSGRPRSPSHHAGRSRNASFACSSGDPVIILSVRPWRIGANRNSAIGAGERARPDPLRASIVRWATMRHLLARWRTFQSPSAPPHTPTEALRTRERPSCCL
jgi:hypothetical protein